jgi:hypothetical protein
MLWRKYIVAHEQKTIVSKTTAYDVSSVPLDKLAKTVGIDDPHLVSLGLNHSTLEPTAGTR